MFVVSSYLAWCFLSVKTYVNTEGKMKSMKSYRVDHSYELIQKNCHRKQSPNLVSCFMAFSLWPQANSTLYEEANL